MLNLARLIDCGSLGECLPGCLSLVQGEQWQIGFSNIIFVHDGNVHCDHPVDPHHHIELQFSYFGYGSGGNRKAKDDFLRGIPAPLTPSDTRFPENIAHEESRRILESLGWTLKQDPHAYWIWWGTMPPDWDFTVDLQDTVTSWQEGHSQKPGILLPDQTWRYCAIRDGCGQVRGWLDKPVSEPLRLVFRTRFMLDREGNSVVVHDALNPDRIVYAEQPPPEAKLFLTFGRRRQLSAEEAVEHWLHRYYSKWAEPAEYWPTQLQGN